MAEWPFGKGIKPAIPVRWRYGGRHPLTSARVRMFSPLDPVWLFADGEQGAFYLPEPQYLYQDSAGTTPVTADTDPVGYVQDLSPNGNNGIQSTASLKPQYGTDGSLHWVDFDGFDDVIDIAASLIVNQEPFTTIISGYGIESTSVGGVLIEGSVGGADAIAQTFEPGIRTGGGFETYGASIGGAPPKVFRLQHPGNGNISDTSCFINGVERAADVVSDNVLNLGATTSAKLFPTLSGRFYSIFIINRLLSATEASQLESYMAAKAGISL